jgi:pimeloyl-ACP methyl ester carboxylesterase
LLRRLDLPTTVIHGTADRLVRPSGGKATAAAIPGAELMLIDGMAHDVPPSLWPRIVDAIVDTTTRR